jgi:N utilization substance protein A
LSGRVWCLRFRLGDLKMSRELLMLADALAREKNVERDIVFL